MLVIRTDKEKYQAGQPVTITLILCNDTATEQEYEFPTSQQYDIMIEQGGNTVWTWSEGRFFMQAFTTLTLKPSECKMFTEQWDQVDSTGQQVPAGTYTVRGIIAGTTLEATGTIEIR